MKTVLPSSAPARQSAQTAARHSDQAAARRSVKMDVLKAAAVLAVCFYHARLLPYGYLGVDMFLVINGFFITRGLLRVIGEERAELSFSVREGLSFYFRFLWRRVLRLWPLILAASAAVLAFGFFTMLPDDYENLSESVVAGNAFANNILMRITSGDYWNIRNEYKPLMHTWYLGVVMQFYAGYPLVFLAARRVRDKAARFRILRGALFAAFFASLLLYCLPAVNDGDRFYLLPFRLFELLLGALCALYLRDAPALSGNAAHGVHAICGAGLALILTGALSFLTGRWLLPLTALCTAPMLLAADGNPDKADGNPDKADGNPDKADGNPDKAGISAGIRLERALLYNPALAALGRCSYSVFMTHQIVLAFVRYLWTSCMTLPVFALAALSTAFFSLLSYRFLEQPANRVLRLPEAWRRREGVRLTGVCAAAFLATTALGCLIYFHAGVVRDVPELEITFDNVRRGMLNEYNEHANAYNLPFPENGRINVLVAGDSYCRDFANILAESEIAGEINVACFALPSEPPAWAMDADYFCYARHFRNVSDYDSHPAYVDAWIAENGMDRMYVVGTKNFGDSNGQIYTRRFRDDYFDTAVPIRAIYPEVNAAYRERFGGHYVDMLAPVTNPDGKVRVFTDDHKFISQDTIHLTRAGARYYAKLLPLRALF